MKVAFISLNGCEGCFYNVISEKLLKLLEKYKAELVDWRLLGIRKSDEYDIAVIEGSVVGNEDLERLRSVRERSKILIALGACATQGGVQAGLLDKDGRPRSTPLFRHVKVDYYVRGCPAKPDELFELLEGILRGEKPVKYEKRFDPVKRLTVKVSDREGFLALDPSKCIVCGRCLEVCRKIGANVLNYVNRGISTLALTPYQEPLDNAGCCFCGLCVAYCPVGAITYKLEPERLLWNRSSEIYIEPEALASLAQAEGMEPSQITALLRLLGYEKVVVYSNTVEARPGKVYAKSPAELQLLRKVSMDSNVELLTPRIPKDAIYVTQCVAWRKQLENVVTTRELQIILKGVSRDFTLEKPEELVVVNLDSKVQLVNNLQELEKVINKELDKAFVYALCFGGCLMGGGQPLSRDNLWLAVYEERAKILDKYLSSKR